jgi:hypothetical protein
MLTTTRCRGAGRRGRPRLRPQLLHQILEVLRPTRVTQHHVLAGRDGQPRYRAAADASAADEANRRHANG